MTLLEAGAQMLPQPNLPQYVPGIVSNDPPTLQCGDCGLIFTATSERTESPCGLSLTVIFSGCEGWGFCACTRDIGNHVRRCGPCNKAHRATHEEGWR